MAGNKRKDREKLCLKVGEFGLVGLVGHVGHVGQVDRGIRR